MKIRLGYVAISNKLRISTSQKVTYKKYKSLQNGEDELIRITNSNLDNLMKILKYNVDNDIYFYRLTSNLLPLATHPEVRFKKNLHLFRDKLKQIGDYIKDNDIRVDIHISQFNVLNSARDDVVKNTIEELRYQYKILEYMNIEGKLLMHIGSSKPNKWEAINRFVFNFKLLPKKIQDNIIIENDDKQFTILDTLKVSNKLNIPIVLDVHHHNCNHSTKLNKRILKELKLTWEDQKVPIKIHCSSPRSKDNPRAHSDYLDSSYYIEILKLFKEVGYKELDIMIEAKQKDLSLYQFSKDIEKEFIKINTSTFKI